MERTLSWALRRLSAALGPLTVSSLYRTRAVSAGRRSPLSPDYLNAAAAGWTGLPPDAVLALGKRLELAAGRTLGARDAPRPLDVDLLLYGDLVLGNPELTLPHPRLAERRFVLQPLADVAADRSVPPQGLTVRQLLARVTARDEGEAGDSGVVAVGWSGREPLAP